MDSNLKTRISELLERIQWGGQGVWCPECDGWRPECFVPANSDPEDEGHADYCELGKILKELEAGDG